MSFDGFKSLSANFTATPNQFFDHIVGHYPSCVVTVVAILIRSTLGWEDPVTGDRRVEAELPLSAFLRPDLCESSARKGLAQALSAGFIVQTARANNRDGSRYALRWEDAVAQQKAIERSRRALQDPILEDPSRAVESGGLRNTPLESGGVNSGGLKNTPPLKDSKKRFSEKERKSFKKQTLNVGEKSLDFFSLGGEDTSEARTEKPQNVLEAGLDAGVNAMVQELKDWGSERRHKQLLSICEQKGLLHLSRQALQATRQRLTRETKQGVLEKPGAYYQRILISLLEAHQVFVPTTGEDDAEEVRRLARQSLGLEG